jgi:IPT/TIG domain.
MNTKIILMLILVSMFFACKEETETDPKIETTSVASVASYICYAKATVQEKGSYGMVDYGFVYSTYNGNFGIDNSGTKVSLGTIPMVADTFSTSFSVGNGYGYSDTFYVRAYYTNKKGTVYGSSISFKPLVLSISSIQPNSGKAGDKISITGNNFSKKTTDNIVKFNNILAKVIEASTTKLIVEVPDGITTEYYNANVPISVSVGGLTLNWSGFSLSPTVTGFSPSSGTFGTSVKITGSNLYEAQVKLNNTQYYTNYNNNNSIQFNIPNDIKTSKVSISVVKNGVETVVPGEFIMNPCSITSISPNKGLSGTQVTISGVGFNPDSYINTIKIGGEKVANYWTGSANTINFTVPETLKSGTYNVTVNNGIEDTVLPNSFTVLEPQITSFTPTSGYYNSLVTIYGKNLSGVQYVGFGNFGIWNSGAEIISRDSLSLVVKVPSNITTGTVNIWASISNKNVNSNKEFTVLPPEITSFSPSEGTPGTIVTIKGLGFEAAQYNTTVKFGTIASTVVSVSPTEIKAVVPSEATAGLMKLVIVTPWYIIATDNDFTVKK